MPYNVSPTTYTTPQTTNPSSGLGGGGYDDIENTPGYVAGKIIKAGVESAWSGLSSAWSALGDAARYADSFFPKIIHGAEAVETTKSSDMKKFEECLGSILKDYSRAYYNVDKTEISKMLEEVPPPSIDCPKESQIIKSIDGAHKKFIVSDNGKMYLHINHPGKVTKTFILTEVIENFCLLELETIHIHGEKNPRKASDFEKKDAIFNFNMDSILSPDNLNYLMKEGTLEEILDTRLPPYFKNIEPCKSFLDGKEDKYSEEANKPSPKGNYTTEEKVYFVSR